MTIAWIYLDKRSAAIDALNDYPSMAFIIQNHTDDMKEAKEQLVSLPSSIPTGLPRAKNPHAGETRLAASLDEIDILKERYRRALEYMEWFQPAWDALSEDEQFVLSEFFLREEIKKADAVRNIGERLFIERSQAYRKKDKAVAHLSLLLFGK